MHRLLAEFGGEPEGDQAPGNRLQSGSAPNFVVPDLRALAFGTTFSPEFLAESCYLGKIGNVAVHIVIDFYVLDYDVFASSSARS